MENYHTGQVVHHAEFGTGRIVNVEETRLAVNFIKAGVRFFTPEAAKSELTEAPPSAEDEDAPDTDELKQALRQVLREEGLVFKPGKPNVQGKSVPIDTFFHKIVMIRNQLRVLEQNINTSGVLSEREKVDLQQYITRCYGSLTTFNVLFADKDDWFVGSKTD